MTYATPEEVRLAEDLGYTWDKNVQRGHVFRKGSRHVWATSVWRDRPPGRDLCWQTADLVDGRYTNHQKFDDLSDALRRLKT